MITHKLCPSLVGRELGVHVVGAGGNGSQMLTGLARMHISLRAVGHPGLRLSLYDPDVITDANVGRQLFSPADVGQHKSRVLINRINCYYGLSWVANTSMWDGGLVPDLLIGCVDSIASRRTLAKASFDYWLDLGNLDRTGQVILGRKPHRHDKPDSTRPLTFFELNPELLRGKVKEDNAPSCSLAAALERQDLFINQAVTTWALHLLWSFIRNGETAIQGYYVNLESGRVQSIPIPTHEPATQTEKTKPAANLRPARRNRPRALARQRPAARRRRPRHAPKQRRNPPLRRKARAKA
jgi:PRTRC genetic system ThiF family protein